MMLTTRLSIRLPTCHHSRPKSRLVSPASSATISNRFDKWMHMYEEFVGLTIVKQAQSEVIMAEKQFLEVQEIRREKQQSFSEVQARLKKLNTELDKIPRTDDRYLKLLTEEHTIIKEEQTLASHLESLEAQERQQFSLLSSALRDSHEKESAQAEKTKYWSVAGSIIGATIGIVGTTINNRLRMRELKSMLLSKQEPATPTELTNTLDDIQTNIQEFSEKINRLSEAHDGTKADENKSSQHEHHLLIEEYNAEVLKRINEMERKLGVAAVGGIAVMATVLWICSKFISG